jgi:hypothetical protein
MFDPLVLYGSDSTIGWIQDPVATSVVFGSIGIISGKTISFTIFGSIIDRLYHTGLTIGVMSLMTYLFILRSGNVKH